MIAGCPAVVKASFRRRLYKMQLTSCRHRVEVAAGLKLSGPTLWVRRTGHWEAACALRILAS